MKCVGNIRLKGRLLPLRALLFLMALVLVWGWALTAPAQAGWVYTGSLSTPRAGPAILLANGMVLVAGGWGDSGPLKSCQLYDPATGTWSDTGSMAEARAEFNLIRLNDDRVLAIGGSVGTGDLCTCEIYDPIEGVWTSTGDLVHAREMYGAARLADGRVLVVGGCYYDEVSQNWVDLNTAELYDNGSWSYTVGSLTTPRHGPGVVRLKTGKVLVAGGGSTSGFLNTCQLYDPGSGLFSDTGSFKDARAPEGQTVLLPNGKVLIAGGWGGIWPDTGPLSSCQLYDPDTGTWSDTGSLQTARQEQAVIVLANGQVLTFGGGAGEEVKLKSAEIYNPATGQWRTAGSLNTARAGGDAAALLPNGKVLAAGGAGETGRLTSCELYTPGVGLPALDLLLEQK